MNDKDEVWKKLSQTEEDKFLEYLGYLINNAPRSDMIIYVKEAEFPNFTHIKEYCGYKVQWIDWTQKI